MKRTASMLFPLVVCGMWLAGCGPSHESMDFSFTVQTLPSGARVYVDGEPRGDSPQKVSLEFEYDPEKPFEGIMRHFVHVYKEGYEPAERDVRLSDPSNIFFLLKRR